MPEYFSTPGWNSEGQATLTISEVRRDPKGQLDEITPVTEYTLALVDSRIVLSKDGRTVLNASLNLEA